GHRHGPQELPAEADGGASRRTARGILADRAGRLLALQIESRDLSDHRVAADPDAVSDFAATEPGVKTGFQKFDAFVGPGRLMGGHMSVPSLIPDWILLSESLGHRAAPAAARAEQHPRSRPAIAIVADGKQPVLDGVADAFLDQCPCYTWNAGAVGALSHQFLKIGDGRKR